MRRKIFTLLVAFFAITMGMMAQTTVPTASLPFVPSKSSSATDAIWYLMVTNQRSGDGTDRPLTSDYGSGYTIGTQWTTPDVFQGYIDDPSTCPDKLLFCFVGDNENGFTVYNKALGDNALQNEAAWDFDPATSGSGVDPTWQTLTKCVFTAPIDLGDFTINKVYFKAGNGVDHDGKAVTDRYKMEAKDAQGNVYGMRAADDNSYYFMLNNDWGSIYQFHFLYVEGTLPTSFSVSATGGTADPTTADAGETITVTANTPATGKVFSHWESADVTFDSPTNPVTTFTMPAKSVSVTAVFADKFIASTNTGDGAVWYIINWQCNGTDGINPLELKSDGTIGPKWGAPDPSSDAELFCFVGNATDGYKIYNKAALAGSTVNGVTADADLPVENFSVPDGSNWGNNIGVTTSPAVSGTDLIDTWLLDMGTGQSFGGDGTATPGWTLIYDANGSNFSWYLSTGSQIILQGARYWGAGYNAVSLQYVSGPAAPTTHTITVVGGTANATEAEEGTQVNITANTVTPPPGQVFDHWETSDVTLYSTPTSTDPNFAVHPANVSFTMPASDVTVTAVFVDVVDGNHIMQSTNTGAGAVWYFIRWDNGGNGFRPWHLNDDNTSCGMEWGGVDATNDAQQFCFIGNVNDGVKVYCKATGDLPLTLLADGNLGFTDDPNLMTDPVIDTWFISVGADQGVDGGPAHLGLTALYNADNGTKGWWQSGGSVLIGAGMNSPTSLWSGGYAGLFQYVSGTPDITVGINAPSQSAFNVYSEKGKMVIDGAQAGALFQVYTITGQKVAGGTLSADRQEVALSSGVYIVKVGNSIKKVIVK